MLGFLLVDKPREIPSFRIIQVLRRLLSIRRIGFAGTLDPLATGLMLVAIGEATKLLPYLEKADKVYEVKIHLGSTSTTYDAQGTITGVEAPIHPVREEIESILRKEFLGERMQKPPSFSAIQIGGKRAYDLARKGIEVDLKLRPVHFYDIAVTSYGWPFLSLRVHCSSGTYIRSLAHDLGQRLGCGGYVVELRRTQIARYKLGSAPLLQDLTADSVRSLLIPPEKFFKESPKVVLDSREYEILSHGGYIDASRHGLTRHSNPTLALLNGTCVGVLEFVQNFSALKFSRKFNMM